MSTQQAGERAIITTPTDREIHVERVFDAPRDRVYTDPELIPEWWGPRGTEGGLNDTYDRLAEVLAKQAR